LWIQSAWRLDLSVFGRRLYDYDTTGAKDTRPRLAAADLSADVEARLRDDPFRRTAAAYGYEHLALSDTGGHGDGDGRNSSQMLRC
jgi:hypothetical protein